MFESQTPFQVQEDFESNFRPGFSQFGNFGQTTGRTVWGAPAEAWENNILLNFQDKSHSSSDRLTNRHDPGHYSPMHSLNECPNSFCFQLIIDGLSIYLIIYMWALLWIVV